MPLLRVSNGVAYLLGPHSRQRLIALEIEMVISELLHRDGWKEEQPGEWRKEGLTMFVVDEHISRALVVNREDELEHIAVRKETLNGL